MSEHPDSAGPEESVSRRAEWIGPSFRGAACGLVIALLAALALSRYTSDASLWGTLVIAGVSVGGFFAAAFSQPLRTMPAQGVLAGALLLTPVMVLALGFVWGVSHGVVSWVSGDETVGGVFSQAAVGMTGALIGCMLTPVGIAVVPACVAGAFIVRWDAPPPAPMRS